MPRPLRALLEGIAVTDLRGDPSVEITGVTHDSRQVTTGNLFCCVPGQVRDGHEHAAAAVKAGAVALLCERPLGLAPCEVVVKGVRSTMGPVAAAFHGHPSTAFDVVGVTGTNGKTTIVWLLREVLEAVGRPTGMIGTLTGARTTPESTDLQSELAGFRAAGARAVALEVSSHALALDRVAGTRFEVAIFTNLSHDHLEFHSTMEDYFAAKARLFEPGYTERAVVNADDPHGELLLRAARVPSTAYSLADVDGLEVGLTSSTGRWRGHRLRVPLGGRYNASNALAVLTAVDELGVDLAAAVDALAGARPTAGRFEPIDAGQPFTVLVDYAHTPDGLDQLLRNVRAVTEGRVIVVFGCGGDKDRDKRPMMGAIAAELADVVVVTDDNPRHEDPQAIIDAVLAGAGGAEHVRWQRDRREAIAAALSMAASGDAVVVAGKGHETTQTIGDMAVPFDDRVVVRELLAGAAP